MRRELLIALIAVSTALGQPFPVTVRVDASVQGFYGPLLYRVTVTAARELSVRVRASVIVPGGGQTGWRLLWEGTLREGESRLIEAREDAVPKLGSYVIWVAVDFASPRDFMVVDSRYYYATHDMVYVVTVYEPSAEHWRVLYLQAFNESEKCKALYVNATAQLAALSGRCDALQAQLTSLQISYASLRTNYTSLMSECARLSRELESIKAERSSLRQALEASESRSRLLLALSAVLAALSLLLAVTLTVQLARREPAHTPPPG